MNILMVSPPAETVLRGGLWQQVEKTSDALRGLGVNVVHYHPSEGGRILDYDLCHVIGANIGSYQLARELHRKGVPIVLSPVFYSRHSAGFVRQALNVQRVFGRLFRGVWIDYQFVAEMSSWALRLLPNTTEEGEFVSRAFDVELSKMTVVPNGVEEKFFFASPDEFHRRYGLKDFVLFVGHFGRTRKNVLTLIRALNKLDLPGVIIGESKDPDYLEQCRREAARGNVTILGGLSGEPELLTSAYAACDVFALPSDYETPGIAALEAALAGAKIVITAKGGTREYFGRFAEYVEPRSEESLVSALRIARQRPKNADLRNHVHGNFLWSRVGEKTLAVYETVLRNRRSI
jgi:glycosyltransferase involved in cell wall biosynthesis